VCVRVCVREKGIYTRPSRLGMTRVPMEIGALEEPLGAGYDERAQCHATEREGGREGGSVCVCERERVPSATQQRARAREGEGERDTQREDTDPLRTTGQT
jgi:hypothetical protein